MCLYHITYLISITPMAHSTHGTPRLTLIRRTQILIKLEHLSRKLGMIAQMRIHEPRILGLLRAVDEVGDRAEEGFRFRDTDEAGAGLFVCGAAFAG